MKAIRTKLKLATALTSMALVNGGIDEVFGQNAPSISTYATGLTNPRGLTFGPDGSLYVAEAGTGGAQTPADIDPSCPVNVNVFSPYTAAVTGARTEVLNGFASLPNELIVGPDGALYTANCGISFAADGGDGQVLRIVP